jgi:hypothetical protein
MRNHGSQLNRSFMIHNIHLVRRIQQLMDYMVMVAMDLENIEKGLESEAVRELATKELARVRKDIDTLVLSTRGGPPPSKEELTAYATGFMPVPPKAPKPKPAKKPVEEIEEEIKEVLNSIFGGMLDKLESDKQEEGVKDDPDAEKHLWRSPYWTGKQEQSNNSASDEDMPDPEDLEDYLKGL